MYLIKAENITSNFENLFSQQDDSQTNSLIKEGHRDHLFTWALYEQNLHLWNSIQ